MTKGMQLGLAVLVVTQGMGCASKATDDQLETMCDHLLEISGDKRGTKEEDEVTRIEEEYAVKEKNLKDEMARDLKGMDDVLTQKRSDVEAGEGSAEEKEATLKAAEENIAKQKKDITDQFERLIKVLGPQKKYAIRDAKKYVKKRQTKAQEAQKRCVEDVKKREITVEKYECRMKAETRDEYFACK